MNQDFKGLLSQLNAAGARYLIEGAHALAAHGHVRATKDMDIWVEPSVENARRVLKALDGFGAPLHDLTLDDLSTPEVVFQIGVAPVRIDILTSIDGVTYEVAWERRMDVSFAGEPAHVISIQDLIANKKATGRLQDLADIDALQRLTQNGDASD